MLIQHVCKTGAGLASRADHVTDHERFYGNITIFAVERSRAPDMSTQRHSTPKMSRSSSSREAEHHAAVSVSFELAVEARTYSAPFIDVPVELPLAYKIQLEVLHSLMEDTVQVYGTGWFSFL